MTDKIKGPELSQEHIGIINEFKTVEAAVLQLIASLRTQDTLTFDQRWLAIGTTDIEKGFMGIIKGICNGE